MNWMQGKISDCLNLTGQIGGEKKNLMIIKELINKVYPFFASLSIIAAGMILVFFGLSKRRGLKIFGISVAAVSIIAAIFLNIRTFGMFGDFSNNLFNFNFFAAAATTVILFAALNILIFISIINFHNDNFLKIILVFLTGIFFFTVFISANNFIMIFTSFAVLLLTIFQLNSVLNSRINKGSFSEYSIKNSIIRFYLAAAFSFLLTFMGYSLIYSSTDFKFFKQLLESGKMSSPLVVTGLFIILSSLYIFMFIFPLQSAYIKMQNRIQYSSMQVVWFFYFPAGVLLFLKLKDVLFYFLSKHSQPVTGVLIAVSAICILGGNIGAIRAQGLRRILSFLFLSMTGQILLGFAQFGLGALSNSRVVWLAVANILFMALIYFPLGLFSSELENRFGSDRIANMTGFLRTQKYIAINILILLLAFGGLIGTAGYVLRFIYLQPFLAGFNKLLSIGPDVRLSVLNISSFAVMLVSWVFIAANVIRLIFCLAKRPVESGQIRTSYSGVAAARDGAADSISAASSAADNQTQDLAYEPEQVQTPGKTGSMVPEPAQISGTGSTGSDTIFRQQDEGHFRFSWFLCVYLTFFSVIIVLSGIMGLLEILGVNMSFLNFSLINLNF
jgi:NADH:ubiquinone oxidoreductase subunit 2 (subunit N)